MLEVSVILDGQIMLSEAELKAIVARWVHMYFDIEVPPLEWINITYEDHTIVTRITLNTKKEVGPA